MPRNNLPAVAVLVLSLTSVLPLRAQHFPPDQTLLEIIRTRVDEGRAVGIVLGVVEADESRRVVSFGGAGTGRRPLGSQSVFEIGSITKVFTGIVLADMVMKGELALDDPVQDYVHDGVRVPTRNGRMITFLDLATHTAGLPRLPDNITPANPQNPYADYTDHLLHEFVSNHTLSRDIGAQYEYSNLAVGFLGHVLAYRENVDYEMLIRRRILDPLGMNMTGIALTSEMRDLLVEGHDQARTPVPNWDIPVLAGAGALRSNMDDMLTFLEANVGEPTNDLERAMRFSHEARRDASGGNRVGLNWHILAVGEDRIVWHNGGTGGYRTFLGFDPDRRVGAVVLTNSSHGADDIGFHLINDAVPLTEAPTERVEVDLAPEILDQYVGNYAINPQFVIAVTLENGQLFVQATGQPRFPIFPESETEFFLRVIDAQITFNVSAGGDVTSLTLHQGGVDQPAERIP